MDAELLGYVKTQVAAEEQLPEGWAERLHGDTLSELRADATQLAQTLGVSEPPTPTRDRHGRFAASMNERIRARR